MKECARGLQLESVFSFLREHKIDNIADRTAYTLQVLFSEFNSEVSLSVALLRDPSGKLQFTEQEIKKRFSEEVWDLLVDVSLPVPATRLGQSLTLLWFFQEVVSDETSNKRIEEIKKRIPSYTMVTQLSLLKLKERIEDYANK